MRDEPSHAALLEVARQTLLNDITPDLKGDARYKALMVANAMGIVAREIEQADRHAQAWNRALARVGEQNGADLHSSVTQLVKSLRSGAHDADRELHEALLETAEVAAGIWKPVKVSAKIAGA